LRLKAIENTTFFLFISAGDRDKNFAMKRTMGGKEL
jgi:hypothetical protein